MVRKVAGRMLVSMALALAGCAGSMEPATTLNMSAPMAEAGGSWSG